MPSGARICLSSWNWGVKVPIDGFGWRGNCLPKCLRLKHICDREANCKPAAALISPVAPEYSTGTWPLPFLICRITCPLSREQSSPVPSHYEFNSGTTCLPENVLGTINTLPTLLGTLLCGVSDASDPLWARHLSKAEIRGDSTMLSV